MPSDIVWLGAPSYAFELHVDPNWRAEIGVDFFGTWPMLVQCRDRSEGADAGAVLANVVSCVPSMPYRQVSTFVPSHELAPPHPPATPLAPPGSYRVCLPVHPGTSVYSLASTYSAAGICESDTRNYRDVLPAPIAPHIHRALHVIHTHLRVFIPGTTTDGIDIAIVLRDK